MSTACPFCERESRLFFKTKDFNRRLSEETFCYYRCPSCRLIFLSPIPANLGDYYPKDYYTIPASLAEFVPAIQPQRFKIEIVQQFKTKGRLLEIGPANGDFAYLAKEAGFEVDTIEMDERCCQFLRDVVGVGAVNSDDVPGALGEMAAKDARNYDVIALWHVIEHLPDPRATLDAVAARLNPGGILLIAAPNPNAFQFKILKRFWPHADAPRHVLLIPIPLLNELAKNLGLKPVLITTTDPGTLGWNKFGWQYFFGYPFKRARLKAIARRVGSVVSRLLAPVEQSDQRGSTYTLIFQKGGEA